MLLKFDLIRDNDTDIKCLYQMKSESNDIYWSGYTQAPDPALFHSWYKKQLVRQDRKIWIVRNIMSPYEVVGYLYLTFESEIVNLSHGVTGIYSGKGIGSIIINYAVNICSSFYPVYSIEAWVQEDNVASVKTFLKNNFFQTQKSRKQYYESMKKESNMLNFCYKKI